MRIPCARCMQVLVEVGPLCAGCATDAVPVQLAATCGNCGGDVLVAPGRWTMCGACGTQSTVTP